MYLECANNDFSFFVSLRFGVSSSSESSPVRNGMRGRRSANEGDDEEGEGRVSNQVSTSSKCPTPQTPQSTLSSILSPLTLCFTNSSASLR